MCGFSGFLGHNPNEKYEVVSKMTRTILHRGPDFQSCHRLAQGCIGFNRLSINDLTEGGNQPFQVGGVTVFCNGEVYNHKQLKREYQLEEVCRSRSDIEVVPHLYRRFGLSCLEKINGMYSMIIIDDDKQETYLITDRWAKKPFYYWDRPDGVYIASELKSFMLHLDNIRIDREILSVSFFMGMVPHPFTPLAGVKRVPPAHIITVANGSVTARKKWYSLQPDYSVNKLSDADIQSRYFELLDDSVKIRMEADVEAGVFCSGGMDSTSVAEAAGRLYDRDQVHAFIGRVAGKSDGTDYLNGVKFANEKKLVVHPVDIGADQYDRLLVRTCMAFDSISFHMGNLNFMLIAEEASKYVKVILDGVSGDELFMGYPWHLELHRRVPRCMRNILHPWRKSLISLTKDNEKALYMALALSDVKNFIFFRRRYVYLNIMKNVPAFSIQRMYEMLESIVPDYIDGFEDVRDLNCLAHLENISIRCHQYEETDRSSMAYSIENRSPFSDYRLWELLMGISAERKLRGGMKGMMRSMSTQLPPYIRNAKKEGFGSPIKKWFDQRPDLQQTMVGYIRENKPILHELFSESFADTIIEYIEGSQGYFWNQGLYLHMVVSSIVWYKLFFERVGWPREDVSFTEFSQMPSAGKAAEVSLG